MEYRIDSGRGWIIVYQDCVKCVLEKDMGNGKVKRVVLIK